MINSIFEMPVDPNRYSSESGEESPISDIEIL